MVLLIIMRRNWNYSFIFIYLYFLNYIFKLVTINLYVDEKLKLRAFIGTSTFK